MTTLSVLYCVIVILSVPNCKEASLKFGDYLLLAHQTFIYLVFAESSICLDTKEAKSQGSESSAVNSNLLRQFASLVSNPKRKELPQRASWPLR